MINIDRDYNVLSFTSAVFLGEFVDSVAVADDGMVFAFAPRRETGLVYVFNPDGSFVNRWVVSDGNTFEYATRIFPQADGSLLLIDWQLEAKYITTAGVYLRAGPDYAYDSSFLSDDMAMTSDGRLVVLGDGLLLVFDTDGALIGEYGQPKVSNDETPFAEGELPDFFYSNIDLLNDDQVVVVGSNDFQSMRALIDLRAIVTE